MASGYRKLAGAPHANGLRLAGCWAHLRRRFFDLHDNGESIVATATVEQMRQLWAVEDEVRGQPPQVRLTARRATSADIVQSLFELWERELPRISGKSKLAEAIRYADRIERSSGASLRRAASNRLQHSRAGHQAPGNYKKKLTFRRFRWRRTDMGVHRHHASDLQNERRRPQRLGQQTLSESPTDGRNKDIEALMPWNFKPAE